MLEKKTLNIDFTKEDASLQILDHAPLLSSSKVGWNGIHLEYHRHEAHETPDHHTRQHIIVIHSKLPARMERKFDGRFQHEQISKDDIVIVPANVPHKSR